MVGQKYMKYKINNSVNFRGQDCCQRGLPPAPLICGPVRTVFFTDFSRDLDYLLVLFYRYY